MLKIEVGLRGQIDKNPECYFVITYFLLKTLFYYYNIQGDSAVFSIN